METDIELDIDIESELIEEQTQAINEDTEMDIDSEREEMVEQEIQESLGAPEKYATPAIKKRYVEMDHDTSNDRDIDTHDKPSFRK